MQTAIDEQLSGVNKRQLSATTLFDFAKILREQADKAKVDFAVVVKVVHEANKHSHFRVDEHKGHKYIYVRRS